MAILSLGSLTTVDVSSRPDLVTPTTYEALQVSGLLDDVGVVEIDPDVSDTATSQRAFGLEMDHLANCVVVGGKRDGVERIAACVVLATTRADVNGTVKRRLDVRKASFLPMERAVDLTGMEYGGITPIGLPEAWPVLIDGRIVDAGVLVIGSGLRRSKILIPGRCFTRLATVQVIDGLAAPG